MGEFWTERLSAKLARRCGFIGPPGTVTYAHWCPACRDMHDYAVDQPLHNGARWSFNGNAEAPSFSPSMNITIGPFPRGSRRAGQVIRCHYFLTDGRLVFCGDCTHPMAGRTAPLPDIPDEVWFRAGILPAGEESA